jgi:hypothetical protein
MCEDRCPQRRRKLVEAHAALERLEHLRELRAGELGLDAAQLLREWPYIEKLVDVDHTEGWKGGPVVRGDGCGHGMAHDHRSLDPKHGQQIVEEVRHLRQS